MNKFIQDIQKWQVRTKTFELKAHSILGSHEASPSRVVILDESYQRLTDISVKQDELFRQALRCVEMGLYRAAHVMAWAGFMDFLEDKICEDGLVKLHTIRIKWLAKNKEELREEVNEFQLIDAAKALSLCTKTQSKALHGLLNKRNECAHPSDFFPALNETLGYVSEIMKRIEQLKEKHVT
jgi:hypothetical protein